MEQISYAEYLELGVRLGNVPSHLFKYRNIDQVKKILDNNSLYFARPNEFNDPFDCQIKPDTDTTEEEIKKFLIKEGPKRLTVERNSFLASWLYNEPDRWKNTIENVFSNVISSNGICCFTRKSDNLLMWSHYTDSHKGICLKFEILKDAEYFQLPLAVKYSNEYPYYNHRTAPMT